MNPPKISVVIPSYNKVGYIGKTLESIFGQNYGNLELIVQDGGSSDGTVEIIKKYAKKYPLSMKWESKKDKGQLYAINKGLNKSTGDLVTYINADDVYTAGSFNCIAKAFNKNPKALWFAGRGTVINGQGREIAKPVTFYKNFLLRINKYPLLLTTNYLMQPSVFITRKAYIKFGQFNGTGEFVTEYDYWLKLGKNQMPIIIDKALSKFRIEVSTKTKTLSTKLLSEDEKIVKKYTENIFILFLHKLNNIGRMIIGNFV